MNAHQMSDQEIKSMPVIYVAGPFRAKSIPGESQPNQWGQEQNIRRAEALALEVWRRGFAAICPHTNTRYYQGSCPDHIWLNGDLAIILGCDGVLLTPDWEESSGATEEKNFCERNDIPYSTDLDDLLDQIAMKRLANPKTLYQKMSDQIRVKDSQIKEQALTIEHLQANVQDWRLHAARREEEIAGEMAGYVERIRRQSQIIARIKGIFKDFLPYIKGVESALDETPAEPPKASGIYPDPGF